MSSTNPKTQQTLTNQALRFLGFRPRSSQEIHQYLSKKTPDSNLVNQVIAQLEELNLIDDQAFCIWFVKSRLNTKPKGPRLIAYELKNYGIDSQLTNTTLGSISSTQWHQSALKLLHKKRSTWQKSPSHQLKPKIYKFLYSKGFPPEIITGAIDEFTKPK